MSKDQVKVGDLAVVIRSKDSSSNIGKIVKVVSEHIEPTVLTSYNGVRYRFCPVVERSVIVSCDSGIQYPDGLMFPVVAMNAACLKPIRDSDGEDETIVWKSIPKSSINSNQLEKV